MQISKNNEAQWFLIMKGRNVNAKIRAFGELGSQDPTNNFDQQGSRWGSSTTKVDVYD